MAFHQINNQSYLGLAKDYMNLTLDDNLALLPESSCSNAKEYDSTGAMYYVVVVIFVFGFSIVLMIGSSMKKTRNNMYDNAVSKYLKDMVGVKRQERRQEKFKFRMAMEAKQKKSQFIQQSCCPEKRRKEDTNTSEKWSLPTSECLTREDVSLILEEPLGVPSVEKDCILHSYSFQKSDDSLNVSPHCSDQQMNGWGNVKLYQSTRSTVLHVSSSDCENKLVDNNELTSIDGDNRTIEPVECGLV